MLSKNYFTISDFAKLMGLSRQTLIYYDRIGLFKPAKTLNNNYRLYSRNQINLLSLITMLAEMGVPLKEIQPIVENISPDTALEILKKQRNEAHEKMQRFQMLEDMISLRIEQIEFGKEVLENKVASLSITEIKEDIPLYLGDEINHSWDDILDDYIIDFYEKCEGMDFPLIFSAGQMKRRDDILAGRSEVVAKMCFILNDLSRANSVIPKGKYAVGYVQGDCEKTDDVYNRLVSFIKDNGLRIVGNAYEEYLLDELVESRRNNFLMKVLIQVAE